jgi:hypothetical protein
VHSLKYRVGRHWLRAHTSFVVLLVVTVGAVIYLVTR